jgi:hypothetical protein
MSKQGIYLTIGLPWSSPPIRGDRPRQLWGYRHRLRRICDRAAADTGKSWASHFAYSEVVSTTMERLESLGVQFDDYGNEVQPCPE